MVRVGQSDSVVVESYVSRVPNYEWEAKGYMWIGDEPMFVRCQFETEEDMEEYITSAHLHVESKGKIEK